MNDTLQMALAFITGGGLSTVACVKFVRKQAQADAMKSVQDVYQETIKDLRDDKAQMKQEFAEKVMELNSKIDHNARELQAIRKLICRNETCPKRI